MRKLEPTDPRERCVFVARQGFLEPLTAGFGFRIVKQHDVRLSLAIGTRDENSQIIGRAPANHAFGPDRARLLRIVRVIEIIQEVI